MLRWLVFVELAGLAWFVLTAPLFHGFPDRGFGLSKAAGPLAIATCVWLGAAAGLPTLSGAFALAVPGALGCAAALGMARPWGAGARCSVSWRALAASEAVFLGVFGLVALLRSASPAALGAEKLMDAALLAATLRAESLPPPDPWLSGHPVNYYYFGALTWATVARAAQVSSAVAYNLALCTIGGQIAAATFSIGLMLSRRVWAAATGAIVLVTGGNLAAALQAWPAAAWRYDLRAPTLAIQGAITEFPFFSLTWGDLHAHLMAAPNVLFGAGCLLALLRERRDDVRRTVLALAAGASVGIASVTSVWDVPPMVLLFLLVVVGLARLRHAASGSRWPLPGVLAGLVAAVACAGPFLRHFESPGLRLTPAPFRSAFGALLLAQGSVLILLAAALAGAAGFRHISTGTGVAGMSRPTTMWLRRVALAGLCVGLAVAAGLMTRSASLALLSALWMALVVMWWMRPRAGTLALGVVAASALLVPEVLVVVEPYGPDFQRLNTVFKLHWHATLVAGPLWAWTLAGLSARRAGVFQRAVAPIAAVAAALALVYPAAATAIRLRRAERPLTLDSTAYLDSRARGDAAIVDYLNGSVAGQPVIVEASTLQYGYAGRVAAYTGLPTVLGWSGHERLWRRSAAWQEEIAARERAVAEIYDGPIDALRGHLQRYHVRYVVVGDAERRQYPRLDPRRFEAVGVRVMERHGASLYEVVR